MTASLIGEGFYVCPITGRGKNITQQRLAKEATATVDDAPRPGK
jgi:hypothetical protein